MKQRAIRWKALLALWAVQVVFVAVAIAAVTQNRADHAAQAVLPSGREQPLRMLPRYNDPRIASDDQLRRVLYALRPKLRGAQPRINHVDHALRMWGVEATFADSDCLSGVEMRQLLTDHRSFARDWGDDEKPLLIVDERGVAVRTQQGAASASHVDHTLAGLAEIGTPITFPVHTPEGTFTVGELLQSTLRSFRLNQTEYEWSALAFALYLPHAQGWQSSEDQQITFDRLARRLMRERLPRGVCFGNHRMFTLVVLLNVDDEYNILGKQTRDQVEKFLLDATARLVKNQHPDGYWNGDWATGPSSKSDDRKRDSLANRVLATGHALEWWAIAPQRFHPPRESLVRAGQWLCQTIEEMDETAVRKSYTFLTHAGRALALWRGKMPAEVINAETGGE
ncbi:MAG: hypothetical protein IIA67_07930 [Planctomycetes bacterium]|nr:hypothetical protein [Planctomycetota bacterium]